MSTTYGGKTDCNSMINPAWRVLLAVRPVIGGAIMSIGMAFSPFACRRGIYKVLYVSPYTRNPKNIQLCHLQARLRAHTLGIGLSHGQGSSDTRLNKAFLLKSALVR